MQDMTSVSAAERNLLSFRLTSLTLTTRGQPGTPIGKLNG